jgi:hypothetical protein
MGFGRLPMADAFDELKAELGRIKELVDLEERYRRGERDTRLKILTHYYYTRLIKRILSINKYLRLTALLFVAFLIGNWILVPNQWPVYSLFPFTILIGLAAYRASLIEVTHLYENFVFEQTEIINEILEEEASKLGIVTTPGERDERGVPLL